MVYLVTGQYVLDHDLLAAFLRPDVLSGGLVTGFAILAPAHLFSRPDDLFSVVFLRRASRSSVANVNGFTTVAFLVRGTIGMPVIQPGARIFRFRGLALKANFCMCSRTRSSLDLRLVLEQLRSGVFRADRRTCFWIEETAATFFATGVFFGVGAIV